MSLVRTGSGLIVRGGSLGGSNECCCDKPCQSCFAGNDLWVQAPGCNIAEPANCANVPLSGFPPLQYAQRRCLNGDTEPENPAGLYGTFDNLEFIPNYAGSVHGNITGALAFTTYGWYQSTLLQDISCLFGGDENFADVDGIGYFVQISLVCSSSALGMRVVEAGAGRREQRNTCVPRQCFGNCAENKQRGFNYLPPAGFVYPWACPREPFTITANHAGVDYAGTFVPWAGIQEFPRDPIATYELPDVSLTFYVRPCKKDNPLP